MNCDCEECVESEVEMRDDLSEHKITASYWSTIVIVFGIGVSAGFVLGVWLASLWRG